MCFLFQTEVVVGVPAIYLEYTKSLLPPNISASAQNCYKVPKGAFTGMYLCTGLVLHVSAMVKLDSVTLDLVLTFKLYTCCRRKFYGMPQKFRHYKLWENVINKNSLFYSCHGEL
jgi:hypothetical protein